MSYFRDLVRSVWEQESDEELDYEETTESPPPAAAPVVYAPPVYTYRPPAGPVKMAGGTAFRSRASFMEGGLEDEEYEGDGSVYSERDEASAYSVRDGSMIEDSVYSRHESRQFSVLQGQNRVDGILAAGGTAYGKREEIKPVQRFVTPSQQSAAPKPAVAVQTAGGNQPCLQYRAAPGDSLDSAVAEFFYQKPHIYKRHSSLKRIAPGRYSIYGREVNIQLAIVGKKGKLLVKDGPLTQPLDDYLDNKDGTAEYNGSVFATKKALENVPQDCRMTFHDAGTGYTRLEAMKVAKEQALVREKAASGRVPTGALGHLRSNYDKTINAKLGKDNRPHPLVHAPAAGAPPPRNVMKC